MKNTSRNPEEIQMERSLRYAKLGLFFGLFSGLFWGLDGIMLGISTAKAPFDSKELPVYLAPLAAACLHDGFSAFWLFINNLLNGKAREISRSLRIKPGLIVCLAALFGGPMAMSGYLMAIKYAGATYTMAITAVYPAVGTVLAMVFLKERVSFRSWIGILICITGSFVIGYSPGGEENHPDFLLGILLALVPTLGWALEGVISTYVMDLLDPAVAINIRQITSFTVYAFLILPFIGGYSILFDSLTQYISGYFILLTALIGSISYLFWYKAMSMTGASRAMALNITYAIWGIVFAYLFTDSEIKMQLIIGASVITSGALLVIANPKELINLRKS